MTQMCHGLMMAAADRGGEVPLWIDNSRPSRLLTTFGEYTSERRATLPPRHQSVSLPIPAGFGSGSPGHVPQGSLGRGNPAWEQVCPGARGCATVVAQGPQVVTGPNSSCSRVRLRPWDSTHGSVISSLTLVITRCAPTPAAASRSTQKATLFPWNLSSNEDDRASPRRASIPGETVQAGQPRQGRLRGPDEEPPVTGLVGPMQRTGSQGVLSAGLVPLLALVELHEGRLQGHRGVGQGRVNMLALSSALPVQQGQRDPVGRP